MTRFNIFNLIHKALRAMLYDTALCMQQTYFADAQDAAAAFEKMNAVIDAFEHHGHTEDTIVMPVIEKFQPSSIASFEKDHVDDRKKGNHLRQLQKIYQALHLADERIIAGSALTRTFRDYMIFNLEHMQREEVELNELLWKHFSDQQIIEINDYIIANLSPEEMVNTAKWFLMSANSQEAENLLSGIQATAPPHLFDALFQMADNYMPEKHRSKVLEAVTAAKETALVRA